MSEGFSIFIGAIWTIVALCVVGLIVGWAIASIKDKAIQDGFFERSGQYYSVKPTVLQTSPRNP